MDLRRNSQRENFSELQAELEEQRNQRFQKEQEIEKYKIAIKELQKQNQVLSRTLESFSIFSTLSPIVSPILNSKNSSEELIEALNKILTKKLQSLLPSLHLLP
jgi:CRISPR/Cas system endoribonuclease Cas6 (RAMP superfamily)